MYKGREIYPQPPLQAVVAEIKYPLAPRLRQAEVCDNIQLALEKALPIRRNQQMINLEFSVDGNPQPKIIEVFRLFNRAMTSSAAIGPEQIIIETTFYREFSEFLALIEKVLGAVEGQQAVPAIERVGLRYLDEIRVPAPIKTVLDWQGWVADDLLAAAVSPQEEPVKNFQTLIIYSTGQEMSMNFRCTATEGEGILSSEAVLKRRIPAKPGPYFVLDIDSYWQASEPSQTRDFNISEIVDLFERLHAPTGRRFQDSLTDKSRALFRGEEA